MMPINTNGNLRIFTLNVGQADTSVIVTPKGNVILIDAVKPKKLTNLLSQLGLQDGESISRLIITHPHRDHYSGVARLLNTYEIGAVTLSSVWRYSEDKPGYNTIINEIDSKGIPLAFLSGYTQVYPDGSPFREANTPCIELLGPSNGMIEELEEAGELDTNHRSIIARLDWQNFIMVIAADAQMENWAHFDREQLLDRPCAVLRAAHHGSANGTQLERLDRLEPEHVYVSSDPDGSHELPDLIGCATFLRYSKKAPVVALTSDTGSIKTEVEPSGRYTAYCFGEGASENVPLGSEQELTAAIKPTDWDALTRGRM